MYRLLFFLFLLLLGCDHKAGHTIEARHSDSSNTYLADKSFAKDGTHSAAVNYYNPETSYRATYKLKVEVKNGEVSKINFPRGSYLNEMHITPEQLDETGNATLYDDEQREFDIEIVD
ncbi:hypothetical protein WBJ53_01940 [Spirosoma sp. SC4-14]|uniref:hypothetical protein n=1 Tax=Spirosoma sp. SC4-14 TaxID=3128900 RepID=UPI0030D28374